MPFRQYRRRLGSLCAGTVAAAFIAMLASGPVLLANTFTVNDQTDRPDMNPGDGVCETSAGTCSLRAAIQEANAGIGPDVIQVPAGTFTITLAAINDNNDASGDFDITEAVAITGAGAGVTIIDGGPPPFDAPPTQLALDRVFEVHATAGDVTLQGLTVRNGWTSDNGGGISNLSNGTLRLIDVTVSDNVAVTSGGGIYHDGSGGGRLVADRSSLTGNSAREGGGLYNAGGKVSFTGTAESLVSISGNHADGAGGGAYNAGLVTPAGERSRFEAAFASFSGNDAGDYGAGVANVHEGDLGLSDVTFNNNLAVGDGGGVASLSKSSVTIVRGTFLENQAGAGGGLYAESERSVIVQSSTFTANVAGESGGASVGGTAPVTISGSSFVQNSAAADGGGLGVHTSGPFVMTDSVVRDNTSGANGGGIMNGGMRVTFTRIQVLSNTAVEAGGGIENQGSGEFSLIDSSVHSNQAVDGGGFHNAADSILRVAGTTFWDNRASGHGGGFYHRSDAVSEIENTTISGNAAQVGGGGLYIDADGGLRILSSTITRNSAPQGSGVGTPLEFPYAVLPVVPSAAATFRNTIVAGNLVSDDCWGPFVSEGGNIDGGTNCTFIGPNDRAGGNPDLFAIADNGGHTLTHALMETSVAIDRGVAPCPAVDQRGVTRPKNNGCDVGAYEYDGVPPLPDDQAPETFVINGPAGSEGLPVTVTFGGSDNITTPEALAFECRVLSVDPTEPPVPPDPTAPPDPLLAFVGCSSPWQILAPGDGFNTFEVRAVDRAGNVDATPATHSWFDGQDTIPPQTTLELTPPPTTSSAVATFVFSATDNITPSSLIEFECRLDGGSWAVIGECANPQSFSNLAPGQHSFEVRALDGSDNIDPSPATFAWLVTAPTTCAEANITLGADADTWIDQFQPFMNFGIDLNLTVRSQAPETNARTLVRFVLPTDLPPCELESATLRLFASSGTADHTVKALAIGAPWSETQVTWNNQPPTASTGPRDDEQPTATSGAFWEWNVTATVAAMLSGAMPNHGYLVRDVVEENLDGEEHVFSSRNTISDVPQNPELVLRFRETDPVPPPAPPVPTTVPSVVACGQVLTESTLVANDLFNCPADGLLVTASNVVIDLGGHTIDGLDYMLTGQEEGLPAGIRVLGSNVLLTNGTVREFGHGVYVGAGTAYGVVEHVTAERNALAGIELVNADNGSVGHTIRQNVLLDNHEGVVLAGGSENSAVLFNTFIGNVGTAILVQGGRGHHMQGNLMSGQSSDPLLDSDIGIRLQGAGDNVIIGNTITEMGDAGIIVELGSHRNVIEGNVMTRPGDAGIIIADSDANQVLDNIVHRTSDGGISLDGASNTIVRGNDVRFNPGGVSVSNSTNNLVDSNDASHSLGSGFEVAGASTSNTLLNNIANLTGGNGFAVEAQTLDANGLPIGGNRLEGNAAHQNMGNGISVIGAGHTLTANAADNNAGFGITAGEGTIDGGGNTALGNVELEQCIGVICNAGAARSPMPLFEPDLTPPDTVITSAPANGASTADLQVFTFTGSDNYSPLTALKFECRLDAGPDADPLNPEGWVECPSPMVFRTMTVGTHTFEVRAIDFASLADPTPATYTWTVSATLPGGGDTFAPETTIVDGPAASTTSSSASFTFRGVDDSTPGMDLLFECQLDGGAFGSCVSPASYALAPGSHTFAVRAIDLSGNVDPTPATRTWTITVPPADVTAPETTITAGPDAFTVNTSATFSFTANEAATFECALDSTTFTACTSPQSYVGLLPGEHQFRVRAVDTAGNTDLSAALFVWTVAPPPVLATLACGDVVVSSVRLAAPLIDCAGDGLVIGVSGITLDLNGLTIDGTTVGVGIRNDGFDLVTITNGSINEFDYGVQLNAGTANNIVSGLRIENSGLEGIKLSDAQGNIVRNNTLLLNGVGMVLGEGTTGSLVHDNLVATSPEDGVRVLNSSGNRFERNQINASSGAGMVLDGSSNTTVADGSFEGNSKEALHIIAASHATKVLNNSFLDNSAGIVIVGSDLSEVVDNTLAESDSEAIQLETAHNSLIKGNDVRYNNGGIMLFASTGNRIEANNASETDSTGISLGGGSLGNVVVQNTADLNQSTGIVVDDIALDQAGNLIDRNTANSNISSGIEVSGNGHTITQNTANLNAGWGIYAGEGNIDGGGNNAAGNTELAQCFNVICGVPLLPDTEAPETSIFSGPPVSNGSIQAIFGFAGTDNRTAAAALVFQCRLDSTLEADFAVCTSPITFNLPLGPHTFEVRAVDAAGNIDQSPASYAWTNVADVTAPETTILETPDAITNSVSARFVFSADDAGSTFQCSIDGGAPAACVSPALYAGLAVGSHTFTVAATNPSALTDPTPASFTWSIDQAGVPTTISCGDVVTGSITVMNDLTDCPADGLVVGASRITIDLNGHLIDGVGVGAGIRNDSFDDVTIVDGTITSVGRDEVTVPETLTKGLQQFDIGVLAGPGADRTIVSKVDAVANEFAGVQMTGVTGGTIRDTVLYGNAAGVALLDGSQDVLVWRNVFTASTAQAILVQAATGNTLRENRIDQSAGASIEILAGSHDTRVERNTITLGSLGVSVLDANGTQIVGNSIRQVIGEALSLDGANDGLVQGNDLRGNEQAIAMFRSSRNHIEGNDASASLGSGVSIENDSHANVLIANSVNANGGDGISIASLSPAGQGNLVELNTASGNTGDGIIVSASGHTIRANTADSNMSWGIYAELGNVDGGGNFATFNAEPEQCFNVVCTQTSTVGMPDTMLVLTPPVLSNSQSATFTFSGTDNTTAVFDLGFECRLDGAAWESCDNPWVLTNLTAGGHLFEVRAIDIDGNFDPSPASFSWTYEPLAAGVAPDTVITAAPALQTTLFEYVFQFTANEPDVTFECSLDGAPFTPCGFENPEVPVSSGALEVIFEPFQAGPHSFAVRAIDAEGLVDATPAVHNWTIVGMVTVITAGPAFEAPVDPGDLAAGGETESTVATFAFAAIDAEATFQCSLDLGPFVACVSGVTYQDLAIGEHLFHVVGTDSEGHQDLEPVEYGWVVISSLDLTAPETVLTLAPLAGSADPVFTFTGSDNVTSPLRLTFECRLDSTLELDFASCLSPFNVLEFVPETLPGAHTLDIRAVDEEGNIDATPVSYSWTMGADLVAPVTAILAGPPATTADPDVIFLLGATDNATPELALTYECSVDAGLFEPCDTPLSVSGMLPGDHTLQVRAIDLALNADATPAEYTWNVVGEPDTLLVTSPAAVSGSAVTFSFASSALNSTFQCSLDGAPLAACASPLDYTGLASGAHSFTVVATNAYALADSTPIEFAWTVEAAPDTTAPETTILSGPALTGAPVTATFTFASSESASTFECSLDGGLFDSCASPLPLADLTGGAHTLAVRATDQSGNTDATPASYSWSVAAAPDTIVLSGPLDTTATTATLTFSATVAGSTFECALNIEVYTACTSPVTYSGLAVGPQVVFVRAVGPAGQIDESPEEYDWVVLAPDTTAPQTLLSSGPATGTGVTTETSATFAFSADEAGATFECQLDSAGFAACTSPVSYASLGVGQHTFQVRAADQSGNVDASPATYPWTIDPAPDTTAPVVSFSAAPLALTSDTTALFAFSANEPGAAFACALDGAALAPCSSPVSFAGLALGPHVFTVRVTDAAGNASTSTASWTVTPPADTVPPDTTILTGPTATSGSSSATITFAASEPGTTFQCALNGGTFASCTSPKQYTSLTVGSQSAQVRAVDAAGNADASPAVITWAIQSQASCGAPVTVIANADAWLDQNSNSSNKGTDSILNVMSKSGNNNLRSLVRFALPTAPAGCTVATATLQVYSPSAVNGRTLQAIRVAAPWDEYDVTWSNQPATAGPAATTASGTGLLEWNVSAQVQAMYAGSAAHGLMIRDATENTGSSEQQFHAREKDETPPQLTVTFIASGVPADSQAAETSFTSTPPDATSSTSATFAFVASEPLFTLQCSLDGAPFADCTSPQSLSNLASGVEHTFAVRSIDQAGNIDATPASYTWYVDTALLARSGNPPETTIESGPAATTQSNSAAFTFASTEANSTYECSLDGANYAACATPYQLASVSLGSHTLEVRATEPMMGYSDPTPASYSWTVMPPVDCGAPITLQVNADAWIDQNSGTTNKGTDSILKVVSKSSGNNMRGLLRFALPPAPTGCKVQSATLRAYAASPTSGRTLQALRINAAWNEMQVTWNNQPATTGAAATTTSGNGYRQWNVLSQVQAMYDLNAPHGFLIRDAAEGGGGQEQQFHSREKGDNPPQVILQFGPQGQ